MCQKHINMVYFSIEKLAALRYDGIMKYYNAEVRMKKQYEKIELNICILHEEIVRTSTIDDPYNDDYRDPNIQFEE